MHPEHAGQSFESLHPERHKIQHTNPGSLLTVSVSRLPALAAVRSLCDALREDATDFANQLVQGVAECLDDPECAPDARALVLLVESHTGIRLV